MTTIKSLSLTNFANYETVTASFDHNVTYLIGPNGAGKTTLGLTGFTFMFQGIAEKASTAVPYPVYGERFRFIGPNAPTAKGVMTLLDNGQEITVTRKLTKDGTQLSFTGPDTMHLSQKWLTDLFNVYLIAPKKFLALSGKEQAKVLGIDTVAMDGQLATLKEQGRMIKRDIAAMGEIEYVAKVERVDITVLEAEKQAVRAKLNKLYAENVAANKAARESWRVECEELRNDVAAWNELQANKQKAIDNVTNCRREVYELLGRYGLPELFDARPFDDTIRLMEKPGNLSVYTAPPEPTYIKELPDPAELNAIDAQITAANATNLAAYQYEEYAKKISAKDALVQNLESNKQLIWGAEQEKLNYIKQFEFPMDGLEINADGDLQLNGKPLCEPYFSTGELLKIIPCLLSVTNPELRYVFIQDFNLLDEDAQAEVEAYLTGKGFQLVVEMVGKTEIVGKNCLVLSGRA